MTDKPVLHGDNGSTLKRHDGAGDAELVGREALVLAAAHQRRQRLCREPVPHQQVPAPSSRPRASTDLDQARAWAAGFVRWYNHDHRHSGISAMSARSQRHAVKPGHPRGAACALHPSPAAQPCALVRDDPQLVAHRRRDAQSRA